MDYRIRKLPYLFNTIKGKTIQERDDIEGCLIIYKAMLTNSDDFKDNLFMLITFVHISCC